MRLLCLTRGEYWERPICELGVPVTWAGCSDWKAARLCRIILELGRRPAPPDSKPPLLHKSLCCGSRPSTGTFGVGAACNDAVSEVHANGRVLGGLESPGLRVGSPPTPEQGSKTQSSLGVPSGRIRLLPNAVDTAQFAPQAQACADSASKPVVRILAVGRLERQKRFDRLLVLLAQLRNRSGSQFEARIVGGGSLGPELKAQAKALGLTPGILEFQPPTAEMASLYQWADILVLTSDWEGTPNVVLEADGVGIAGSGDQRGGVADLVRQGVTGLLADPDDARLMLENLAALVESARLRSEFGENSRDFVVAHRSLKELPGLLRAFYSSISDRLGLTG